MIEKFVRAWERNKETLRATFREKHPENYLEIVQEVIKTISDEDDHYGPSASRITEIDDGGYQGTLVYVIAAKGYQPSDYWYVKVSYGSCSGCDTLEGIRYDTDRKPTEDQVRQYMMLALHIVQWLKPMDFDNGPDWPDEADVAIDVAPIVFDALPAPIAALPAPVFEDIEEARAAVEPKTLYRICCALDSGEKLYFRYGNPPTWVTEEAILTASSMAEELESFLTIARTFYPDAQYESYITTNWSVA